MTAQALSIEISNYVAELINQTLLAPAAIIPSVGIAILTYLLVTRQLDMIQDDSLAGEEFGTVGEANEWLGGPTSEWLGI